MTFSLLTAPAPLGQLDADRGRIQRHLAAVEAELRAKDAGHLPAALQQARSENLDRLHAYRVAGIFPRNSHHPGERVPYFIDDDGVLCAVGHLVAESGFTDVAREIQASENNHRLLAMNHPALPAWIAASGLTEDECALIQPTYCRCDDIYAPVCGVDGVTYENTCYAVECNGVEVAYEGVCKGEDTTTGWPDPGSTGGDETGGGTTTTSTTTHEPETGSPSTGGQASASEGTGDPMTTGAPVTTGGPGESDSDAPATDASAGSTTNSDSSGGAHDSASDPDSPKQGCDCRSTDAPAGGLLLALLALLPRRRGARR